MRSFATLSVSLLALGGSAFASLPSITAKGSKFFYPNGTQFFIKGVAYQQDVGAAGSTSGNSSATYVDPLADGAACKRDIPYLVELGTNVIRTYAIDPTADHSTCMGLLEEAGIYVISDLGNPSESINRADPQWTTSLYARYTAVIDELGQYSNVIGFFAGNEVSNNGTNTGASAYVKAAVRDSKKHIADNHSRWMGVGYAANDDVDIRANIAHYFNCGEQEDAIDFWGYNIYSWCGQSNMQKSGYDVETEFFSNYSVPVFFAEYGCNLPNGAADRPFTETAAIYGDVMDKVFSGAIVYMYFEETNDYGLVQVSNGDSVSKLKDFGALQTQVAKADPSGVEQSEYSPTNSPAACPAVNNAWQANSALPPTPDAALCECMMNSRSCVPASGLAAKDYGAMFGFICGSDPKLCAGVAGNATTGIYGAFSMCTPEQQLAFVLDAYYVSQNSASTACDFESQATVQSGNTPSNCTSPLAQANNVNSLAATATAPITSATGSSSSNTESMGVASARSLGALFYLASAAAVGAGLVLL